MKRFLMFTIFIILFLTNMSVYAASTLNIDGTNVEYFGRYYDVNINGEKLETDMLAVVLENRSLVPARAVFEKLGASVVWYNHTREVVISLKGNRIGLKINDKTATVNQQKIDMDVPAMVINGRTMVPLRFVGEQLGYEVSWVDGESSVYIFDKAVNITEVLCEHGKEKSQVILKADGKIKNYLVSQANNPARLIIDVPASSFNLSEREIEVGKSSIEKIRLSQFKREPLVTRMVIDLSEWPAYKVDYSPDGKSVIVEFIYKSSNLKDVRFSREGNSENISITLDLLHGSVISRLSDPERLVIDLPQTIVGRTAGQLDTAGRFIKRIRYAQFNEDVARVVADIAEDPQYEVLQEDNKIIVRLFESPFKGIEYFSNDEEVYFTIENCNLEGKYSRTIDLEAKMCSITFPASEFDIVGGVMNINDSNLEYVDIDVDKATNTARMIFKGKHIYSLDVIGDEKQKQTTIVLGRLDIAGDKLVVIDPGHGGTEPGTLYKDILEKDLNLDISLRLNELLKSHGVKTYMLREKDVTIDVYDRPRIANELKADLYISVHNNGLNDINYDGTMTLYYPNGVENSKITSKRLAEIVHEKMISALGTTDRKIIPRPNLVVLRDTKMPAVLSEVAFLTNRKDRENLLKESFRQKAAQALCDAVLQALAEMAD